MGLTVKPEVTQAIKDLRTSDEAAYVVAGYEGKDTLTLLSSGPGGFDEVCKHLVENDFCYALYSTTLVIDRSKTTKFVFVRWAPETTPPLRKALLGTHGGEVSDTVFQPYHVDLYANDRSDLVEEDIIEKIESAAGVRIHELSFADAAGRQVRTFTGKATEAEKPAVAKTGGYEVKGASLGFVDKSAIEDAIKEVRNDASETDWVLIGYEGKTELKLIRSGSGGVEAMLQSTEDAGVNYGMFRTTEVIDRSTTVKFIFIEWQPETIPMFFKATIATHKGVLEELFAPYHTQFRITQRDELTESIVKMRLSELSGQGEGAQRKINIEAPQTKVVKTPKKIGVASEGAAVAVTNRDEIAEAISNVRQDQSDVNWAVIGYDSPKAKSLVLVGSGSDGVDGLKSALMDNSVNYGILRVEEQIDKSKTVKFVFVHWQPESAPVMMKATVSTHKGVVRDLIGQYHVDIFATERSELSVEIVATKVGVASGTLSGHLN